MKKLLLAFVLLIGVSSFNNNTAEAQNVNININIGNQPAWGPVGYDYVGYYYFPDIDCYYNVNTGMYYFYERGRWVSARYLPYAYSNYDLYGLYKVVLNVNNPWTHNSIHRRDYARYVGRKNQKIIRDSRDQRYSRSRQNNVVWHSASSSSSRPTNSNVSRPTNSSNSTNNSSTRPSNNNSNVTKPSNNSNNSSTRPSNSGSSVNRPSSNSGSSTRPSSSSSGRSTSTSTNKGSR